MTGTKALSRQPPEVAIPRLFAEHGDRIYRLGLRVCGKPDEAEDLVQETFLSAFRKWRQFEGRAEASTWLYSIAARACGRRKRLRAGEPKIHDSLSAAPAYERARTLRSDAESPLDAQLRRELRDAVERGLAALPAKYRIPVVLKDIAELPIADIAAALGLQIATVKTRIHRGRLMLREVLGGPLPPRDPVTAPSRETCLDLLAAKQEALDRGSVLPLPHAQLCARCQHLFADLDLGQDACRDLDRGTMPEPLRTLIAARIGPR